MDLSKVVRDVPDFPHKGIMFRDITPVIKTPEYFRAAVDQIIESVTDIEYDVIAGPESRGFIFGTPVAVSVGKGFVPIRKAGKLPYKTIRREYDLEYGSSVIEMHIDAIDKGQKVLIVDDLLATGGTSKAMCELIESAGGIITGLVFLIELSDLDGRKVLSGYDVRSILKY
ncbi:MAG: adenine phosphoribosyltransferase [Clostridiales bacterium]|nr:adenine phosphoribosyltransferase [Clostridiales bacterium]